MNLGLSLSMGQGLELRHELGYYLLPVCRIVGLMKKKGSITKLEVVGAIDDFRKKHGYDSLASRVDGIYTPEINTPKQAVAYWIRSVSDSPAHIASLCLEEDVSRGDSDVVEASMIVI